MSRNFTGLQPASKHFLYFFDAKIILEISIAKFYCKKKTVKNIRNMKKIIEAKQKKFVKQRSKGTG